MAGSVNKVILIGNLGRDPEVRNLNDGSPVANLSLATEKRWKDKNSGETKKRTEWHRVTCYAHAAEFASKYLRKGSKVYVEGELQTRKWQHKDGSDRFTTEIIVQRFGGQLISVDGRDQGERTQASDSAGGSAPARRPDSDIPF